MECYKSAASCRENFGTNNKNIEISIGKIGLEWTEIPGGFEPDCNI